MEKYRFSCDDPYKLVASYIVAYYSAPEVLRFLEDDQYVLSQIAKEVRSQDLQGRFVDLAIEGLLKQKKRMEYMHELDKLADYFYSKLDVARLRSEIITELNKCGLIDSWEGFVREDVV